MIYVCSHCHHEMTDLRTEGHDVNSDLICATCAKAVYDLLKKAREIQYLLLNYFRTIV